MAKKQTPEDALNLAEGQVTLGLSHWDYVLEKLPKSETTELIREQAFAELAYWLPSICKDR